jgi:hypothetical protein
MQYYWEASQRIASNAFVHCDSWCSPTKTPEEEDQIQPVIRAERVVKVVIVHCELFQLLGEYVVGVILREASPIFPFTATSERD